MKRLKFKVTWWHQIDWNHKDGQTDKCYVKISLNFIQIRLENPIELHFASKISTIEWFLYYEQQQQEEEKKDLSSI